MQDTFGHFRDSHTSRLGQGSGRWDTPIDSIGSWTQEQEFLFGFDYQSQLGFHLKAGASYHLPLFVGHRRTDNGQNLVITKESLNTWTSTLLSLNYEFSLGWTF